MRQCNRCGERNHDDAQYCGTCGLSMPTDDGIESLVADDAGWQDDNDTDTDTNTDTVTRGDAETDPGAGPGAAGLQTSEYVAAPTFGETGPATTPASVPPADSTAVAPPTIPPTGPSNISPIVPPTGGVPSPGPVPMPVVRSSRSASVMIAALVVAAVVIIGGVFILLASGPRDAETARTGEDPTAPPASLDAPAPTTVAPVPSEVPSQTLPPVTTTSPVVEPPTSVVPVETPQPTTPQSTTPTVSTPTVSTPAATTPPSPAPSSSPAPVSTAPPAPAPTAPTPSRGPGDLGLTQPILDESCDGRYITFVGSAIGERPYRAAVGELLDLYPGANYIWTKACPSLRQEFTTGADIYGVVFGPYTTQQQACDARSSGPDDAYVRRISTTDPEDHTIRC